MSSHTVSRETARALRVKIENVGIDEEELLLSYLNELEEIVKCLPDYNWQHEKDHLLVIRIETEFMLLSPKGSTARLKMMKLICEEMLRVISKRI